MDNTGKLSIGIALIIGLVVGFGLSTVLAQGNISDLKAQVSAQESLQKQLTETKTQLELLNVNELYGMIKVGDSAKAYKIGDLNGMPPKLANDVVGSTPVIVSWCPLCGALTAYDRRVDGKTLTFEVEGPRKLAGTDIDNLHFKDASGSVWAQGPGAAVEGTYKGEELKSIPVQLFNRDVIEKMGVEIWQP